MESKITFEGAGPFDLPIAQQVSASPADQTVLLTFRVMIDPNRLKLARIAVPNNLALDLAAAIVKAAETASEHH